MAGRYRIRFARTAPGDEHPFQVEKRGWLFWSRVDHVRFKTVDVPASCRDMTWALPGTSGVPTLAVNSSLGIYGSLTLVSGMLANSSTAGTIFFIATSTGKTITTAGVELTSIHVTFSGAGGGWTLQDALSMSAARTLTVSAGTFNSNAKTITTGFFVSTSGTRTLTLTGSTINLTGAGGMILAFGATASLTWNVSGSTFNLTGQAAGTTNALAPAGLVFNNFNITGGGFWSTNSTLTAASFSWTSTTSKTDSFSLGATLAISAAGSLTLAGNSTVNRAFVKSNVLGTQRAFSVPSGATVSLTNVDFQDIASAGTFGTWTGTSLGDCLGNSGITFDASTTQTYNYISGSSVWSNVLSWTSRVPLPQDDVIFQFGNVSIDMPRIGRNWSFQGGYAGSHNYAITATSLFGNLSYGATMSFTGTPQTLTLAGRGAQTITDLFTTLSGSKPATTIAAPGGSYTFLTNFNLVQGFVITHGTLNGNGFDLFASAFTANGVGTTVLNLGSGTYSLAGPGGTRWAVSASNCTVNAGTSTIKFTQAALTSDITFSGAGYSYYNFWWSPPTAAFKLIIAGANTFNDFRVDGTTARTVQFPASTTQTLQSFTVSGTTSNLVSLRSSTAGTRATLSCASGIIQRDYLDIKDIAATGGATWYAGGHSTDSGNNTGWIFGVVAATLANLAALTSSATGTVTVSAGVAAALQSLSVTATAQDIIAAVAAGVLADAIGSATVTAEVRAAVNASLESLTANATDIVIVSAFVDAHLASMVATATLAVRNAISRLVVSQSAGALDAQTRVGSLTVAPRAGSLNVEQT